MKKLVLILSLTVLALGGIGCGSTGKGAAIGAGAGAAIGAVIGHQSGNTATGALIGAGIGGAAGAVVGHYMDDAAEEMERDLEGAKIERVGEGIKITFDSGILFDVNRADVQPAAKQNLTSLAAILDKYDDTEVLIEGHTDADGSQDHNLELSERRANAVKVQLVQGEVSSARMTTVGYGEVQPVADNSSTVGKAQNRRVEIAIMANDDLKKAAEKKAASAEG